MNGKAESTDAVIFTATGESVMKEEEHSDDAAAVPRSMMIGHLSEPPLIFADGDEGNPRNWPPRRKMAIAIFVIVAGFVA